MITNTDVRPDADYVTGAVRRLPARWNDSKINRSGLRAVFRRWRPRATGMPVPENAMVAAIIAEYQLPAQDAAGERMTPRTAAGLEITGLVPEWQIEHVCQAATVVAMRAMAGEHSSPAPDPGRNTGVAGSMGAALYRAGLSDMRFMRLMATPRALRVEALLRACRLLNAKQVGMQWGKPEVERILMFLFGTEAQAEAATLQWVSAFFGAGASAPGKAPEPGDDDNSESNNSNA